MQEATYALNKINKREMFTATNEIVKLVKQQSQANVLLPTKDQARRMSLLQLKKMAKEERLSVRLQWMNEFSDVQNEIQSNMAISMIKSESRHLEIKDNHSFDADSSGRVSALGGLKKK
jgi:DNA polymerase III delta prime subunit